MNSKIYTQEIECTIKVAESQGLDETQGREEWPGRDIWFTQPKECIFYWIVINLSVLAVHM